MIYKKILLLLCFIGVIICGDNKRNYFEKYNADEVVFILLNNPQSILSQTTIEEMESFLLKNSSYIPMLHKNEMLRNYLKKYPDYDRLLTNAFKFFDEKKRDTTDELKGLILELINSTLNELTSFTPEKQKYFKERIKEIITLLIDSFSGTGEEVGQTAGNEISNFFSNMFSRATEKNQEVTEKAGSLIDSLIENTAKQAANSLNKGVKTFDENIEPGVNEFFAIVEKFIRKAKNSVINALLNPWDIAKYSTYVGGGLFTAFYTPSILKQYVIYRFISPKPTILLPGSKIGYWDRFTRWRNNYQSPSMIFPTQVKEYLQKVVDITKMIKANVKAGLRRCYRNLLLYGPPGTGKTLFATILADLLDMDFCSITAASLLQKDAGVKFLNDFVKMAKSSRHGIILFIDEADALFIPRDKIDTSTEAGLEHLKVLNHLLAMTGDGSNKFMVICATNHSSNLDDAMGRRFQDRILMPLPDADCRKQLIIMYAKKLLFDALSNGRRFVASAQRLLNMNVIQKLVERLNGLSSAEIKDIIEQIRNLGLNKRSKELTIADIEFAVTEGLKKKQAEAEDAKKRAAQAQNKSVVQLNIHAKEVSKIDSSAPVLTETHPI